MLLPITFCYGLKHKISLVFFCSGNHERDWPNSGSFYDGTDSGGECGVLAETMFSYPAKIGDKFW